MCQTLDVAKLKFQKKLDCPSKNITEVSLITVYVPTSFFSIQLTENTIIAHNGTIHFNHILVNYGDDYIQSGGIYMYALQLSKFFISLELLNFIREKSDFTCCAIILSIGFWISKFSQRIHFVFLKKHPCFKSAVKLNREYQWLNKTDVIF